MLGKAVYLLFTASCSLCCVQMVHYPMVAFAGWCIIPSRYDDDDDDDADDAAAALIMMMMMMKMMMMMTCKMFFMHILLSVCIWNKSCCCRHFLDAIYWSVSYQLIHSLCLSCIFCRLCVYEIKVVVVAIFLMQYIGLWAISWSIYFVMTPRIFVVHPIITRKSEEIH